MVAAAENGEELQRVSKFAIWIFQLENWTPFKTFHFFYEFTVQFKFSEFWSKL